jgi:carbon storage regulator
VEETGKASECLSARNAGRTFKEECPMLVLTRKLNEEIVIAGQIEVQVLEICGNRVRLGITAPADISIQRREICVDAAELDCPLPVQFGMQKMSRVSGRRRKAPVLC